MWPGVDGVTDVLRVTDTHCSESDGSERVTGIGIETFPKKRVMDAIISTPISS